MNRCRRSIRLREYDYSRTGAYFVTVCTQNRECLFGKIVDEQMVLNNVGRVVVSCWENTPNMRPNVELDEFILMPNHIHAIVVITKSIGRGVLQYAPTTHAPTTQHTPTIQRIPTNQQSTQLTMPTLRSPSQTIGAIIRGFKSTVTTCINKYRKTPGIKIWQRNYYERIIRNDDELNRIREYIVNNPAQWESDQENPVPYWNGDIHE